MNTIYLELGTNVGTLHSNIELATASIRFTIGKIVQSSNIYQAAAWGKENQADFYNQILCVETELGASEVLAKCQALEDKMGRVRQENWGPRVIDIDILFFNDEVIDLKNLKVPHPHLQKRNFVLVPMCDVAPDLVHPVLGKDMKTLLSECDDQLPVVQLELSK